MKKFIILAALCITSCSQEAGRSGVSKAQQVMVLTCSGTEVTTGAAMPTRPHQILYRFDENEPSLSFWYAENRSWGIPAIYPSASFDVRDDFMMWTALSGSPLFYKRTVRFDRAAGTVSQIDELGSFSITFTGHCEAEVEEQRVPLSPEQRAF